MITRTDYRSWVEVDLDNFARNWAVIRRLVRPGVKIMQVLKADAYGHGAMEIANVALRNGAACLGVANADEGVQLRVAGIEAPIVVLSPSLQEEIPEIIKYNLVPSISDLPFALLLQKQARAAAASLSVHLEIDSGIGRAGIRIAAALDAIRRILEMPNLFLEGIFTHLSVSEASDDYNLFQWQNFNELLLTLAKSGINIPIKHMANSGALINYPSFQLDMVRPGIISYGVSPMPDTTGQISLEPVMTFKTRIVLIKEFPGGSSIGYGRAYVMPRAGRIATIPVGYGDGYGFVLSNRAEVLIGGKRVPLVGRISMDLCTIDVSDLPGCAVGDEVVLLGRQGREYISADEIARRVGTISYEVLCALGKRAPRIFLNQGEIEAVEPRLRRIFIPDEEKSLARIDNIIRRCLQTRARNVDMGDAIYYEMFENLFGKSDRQLEIRTDFRYVITVSEPKDDYSGRPVRDEQYLDISTHIQYRKILKNHIFLIGCASDNEQLASFFEDPRCQYRWLLSGGKGLEAPGDFQVKAVRVDGQEIPIQSATVTDRGYEVWAGSDSLREKLLQPVLMEIEILTKQDRAKRDFSVHIVYPTQGLEIIFNYAGAGLKNVREVIFLSGRRPYPPVRREEGRAIEISLPGEDWVFPHSGITFVWDL